MKFSSVIPCGSRNNRAIANRQSAIRNVSAFTMVEVAISLAIIGIALVAIIGVLPLGMNAQRDNREATVINQDASVFLQAVRNGARGLDDLTNFVYAIVIIRSNAVTGLSDSIGYTSALAGDVGFNMNSFPDVPANNWHLVLTSGANIIGLLSTPEFTDDNGNPTNNFFSSGYSNRIIASVRAMSGPAVEKPPQDNPLVRADAFGYRMFCVNAPVAANLPSLWQSSVAYNQGDQVYWNSFSWQATAPTAAGDRPGSSSLWTRNFFAMQLAANLHDLRLTFLWPIRPNGTVGAGRQTFRALIPGQIQHVFTNNLDLYF